MEVKYINHCGDDLQIVNAARVSFNKVSEWETKYLTYEEEEKFKDPGYEVFDEFTYPYSGVGLRRVCGKDIKLINYLAKHEHFSPFNHTFITMHVKAPIFVARQLVKHEYMPWNEVSRRYVDDEPEFYWPELRERPEASIKQGSGNKHPTWNHGVGTGYYQELKDDVQVLIDQYNEMIRCHVAPEQARMVLPQNMYTEWYWSGTLKAWAKMYNLRIDSHAQKETQEVAKQAGAILAPLFPVVWKALTDGKNKQAA